MSGADELRDAMTDKLIAGGWITSPDVEAAFRAVPRHEFVPPGTPLEQAYGGSIVRTERRRTAARCRPSPVPGCRPG